MSQVQDDNTKNNEYYFERCIHDKQNPYVMISRQMAQDKSISPKAKGVLLYLLSLPPDWKIYHSQLQEALGIGEDYLNSAMEELIKTGYAERTRKRVNGIFQPYKYIIREFKKSLPDGISRTGSSGPVNPVLQSKEGKNTDIQNKQQQGKQAKPANAAAFSDLPKDQSKEVKIHNCLLPINLDEKSKVSLSQRHPEHKIITGLKIAASKKEPPKNLGAFLEWVASNDIPYQEPKKALSVYDRICRIFKNGQMYNQAECYLKPSGLAFYRGMKFGELAFDKYFSWKKLEDLCLDFGISYNKELII